MVQQLRELNTLLGGLGSVPSTQLPVIPTPTYAFVWTP